MRAKGYRHSLRFKIALGLLLLVACVSAVTSWIRYTSFRRLLLESTGTAAADAHEIPDAQIVTYARSRLALSIGSIVVIVVISDLMVGTLVVHRLKQFLGAVNQVYPADLDVKAVANGHDEIGELYQAFNRIKEDLQSRTEGLSALSLLAATVSQSLDLEKVLHTSLNEALALMHLSAGWITLKDHDTEFHMAASRGLPHEATVAHARCRWEQCVCASVFDSGQSQIFHDRPTNPCPAAEYLEAEGLLFRACVPLLSKDRVLGVMSLAGTESSDTWVCAQGSLEILTAIGRQVGVAVENARLYTQLSHTEALRRQLMERGIDLQEEERKRIARELHDQTSQRLTSILMTLGALADAGSTTEVSALVRDLRQMVLQTLEEVHDLALELRPRLLDDLGLLAALQHCLMEFRDRCRVPVDLQVLGLDDNRLPSRVETALYRIAQEALANVRRHAQAENVGVLLEHRGSLAMLIVEDDGSGFDVSQVMGSHVHEGNLGLYGMRERAALLGGMLTIESAPGEGTSVFVEIPLDDQGRQL
jgi:signal transduction histidine kinase